MGSRAPLIRAWRGGEPRGPRDPGPRPATCSTGDNCPRTSSALWPLHHCLYPSCAPKLSPARASLGRLGFRDPPRCPVGSWWVRSTGEGVDWRSEARCQSAAGDLGRAGDLGGRGGASPGENWTTARCKEGCGPGVGAGLPDAPASDPQHGEGSSGGRDSLRKSWRARKAGMEPLILALGPGISTLSPLLQMRTIEVGLEA